MNGKIKLASSVVVAALLSTTVTAQDNSSQVPIYEASYSVGWGSITAGNAHFTLNRNPDGTYTYQSVTRAAGLVALFRSDVITETSRFRIADGNLQSIAYSYDHAADNSDKKEDIQFDWIKDLAHCAENGKQRTLSIKPGTYDRLLAQLAISMNLNAGRAVADYPVLDHNEITVYRMRHQGIMTLKTPAGEYETVELTRKVPRKNRVTTFWLAPKLDYLPVQMQQTEPGKSTISLVLTDIKFDAPNSK